MYLFDKRIIYHFDFILILLIIPLILLSYTLINEINETLANKQLKYISLSLIAFVFFFILSIRKYIKFIPILYWLGIILLISVEFFGITKLGAKRWIDIPILNMTIQPSELIKPIFLLMLAYFIHSNPPPKNGYLLKDFIHISFYILLPFYLIVKQPDLGTGLILLLVGYGILFIVGVNFKIWISIVLFILISSPFTYTYLIKDYQKKRISDFIAKEPSYHVKQSIIAIGSGGLLGKDKKDATQTQLKFLPISTSDFIFAYYIERYGFIGSILLIILYLFIIIHLLSMNYYFKDDYLIKVFSSGVSLLVFFNMSVNILMVIGLAPVVGLPLPLFSYGGSSFINFVIIFAILEHLISFRYSNMYDYKRHI
jgi:rod shape determining protein RodA